MDKLKEWPPELALKFKRMLMEHHNIFSLEQNEIGCTDTAEHVIELLDTEPFKEKFQRIAPPLVEEVREHIQEMLDGGAIHPSQSPWCNAIVLMRKKDGGLRFYINFCRLNSRTKKDALPPSPDAGDHGIHGRHPFLLHYGLEIRLLAGQNGQGFPAIHRLYGG